MSESDNSTRRIYMACDGFGEELKDAMKSHLESKEGYKVEDLGTDTYFDAAGKVASAIVTSKEEPTPAGILVCGTGMGVGIVANKFPGVRAATVENVRAARCARAVNDANVLCLGQLVTSAENGKEVVDAFFAQDFISQPTVEGGQPAPWWNSDVEKFLCTSKEGIARVERDAMLTNAGQNQL